ncbi:hypothetical protein LIT25_11920 [Bacillus sp. F19]|nr:hypothetical protein LIT25_11920 [Bacillus sp. F19]
MEKNVLNPLPVLLGDNPFTDIQGVRLKILRNKSVQNQMEFILQLFGITA